MSRIPFKRFVPRIGGTIIGVTIFEIIAFFFINDKKFITFTSANLVVTELLSIVYDSYYPRPAIIETPTDILPITNDVPITNEKPSLNKLSTQKKSHSMWFKLSVVSGLSIFFVLMGSTLELPLATWGFYISFELYHFLNRLYIELFPSNKIFIDLMMKNPLKSTKDWSKKKIIFVTVCIDLVQFLCVWITCTLALGIVIPCIFDIIYNYCNNILKAEDDSASLLNKITNFMVNIFDNYPEYIFVSTISIGIRILPYFLN